MLRGAFVHNYYNPGRPMGRQRGFTIVQTPFPVYIRTRAEAEEWVDRLYDEAVDGLGYDTETTGLDVIRDRVKFFSFATKESRICGPVRLLPVFAELLEDPQVPKRLTNAKYDMHLTANHGILIWGHAQDTADQDFLYDENRQGRHGLKPTAADHLGLRMTPFKKLFGDVGGVDREVETLCEVHGILEMYDHDGEQERALELALKVLIRLRKVEADEKVMKVLKWLDLAMKSNLPRNPDELAAPKYDAARKVLKIARDYGYAGKTSGQLGYVNDFVQMLGGPKLPALADRRQWAHLLTDPDRAEEAYTHVWESLLEHVDMGGNPVERLRLMVTDYASLDAWASHMITDELRDLLELEDMQIEDQEDLADAFEFPLTILEEALLDEEEGSKEYLRLENLLEATEGKLENVEDRIDAGEPPESLFDHSENVRAPFIRTLWNMERRGFVIRVDDCAGYSAEMQEELNRIDREIVKETRDLEFNPNSSDQLREKIFSQNVKGEWEDPFGDKPKKMTSGGQSGIKAPSTAAEVLEGFAGKGHHLSKLILERRGFAKLKGTYMDGLLEWVDRRQRIHTNLKSTGARTWRLSSSNPNLQNIPARDPLWGPRIRKLFIAGEYGDCDPEWCLPHLRDVPVPRLEADFPMVLLVADYKQLEMRIMAHFSRDPGMIEAILKGRDMHCQTVSLASQIGAIERGITYDIAYEAKQAAVATAAQEILIQHRTNLKATGFGIIYGIGALKLGMQLGLPIVKVKRRNGRVYDTCPAAQKLIEDYLEAIYPGVGEFIALTHERCRRDLVVHTIAGHPRRLPDILSRDRGLSSQAERQSVNSIVQGSAADITNKAMLLCEGDEELRRLGVRQLLQIHDELVFEVPDDPCFVEPAKARIKFLMEDPFDMLVPIDIDMDTAYAWGDAKG